MVRPSECSSAEQITLFQDSGPSAVNPAPACSSSASGDTRYSVRRVLRTGLAERRAEP
jgi:hypothetical protein